MAPMKILVWQWGHRGAGPRFAAETAAALEAAGMDVTLSLSSRAEAYGTLAKLCRKRLDFAGRAPGRSGAAVFLGLPLQLWRLFRAVRRERPAIGLCSMVGYWDVPFALLLRACGVRVFSIVHEVKAHPGDVHRGFYGLQRLMVRLSDGIVTLSNHVGREVAARWPSKPVVQTFHPPFAFDDLELPPATSVACEAPLRLLVTGRMWGYKGTAMALDAFQILPAGSSLLRIVGNGDSLPLGRHDPARGMTIESRWLSEAELVGAIDAADIVLFPYMAASQSGLVPLCLSRGRPVVVTPVGGLEEQVRPATSGVVASGVSADEFAAAIRLLMQDGAALSRISQEAIRANEPHVRWQVFAEHLAAAFRSCLP